MRRWYRSGRYRRWFRDRYGLAVSFGTLLLHQGSGGAGDPFTTNSLGSIDHADLIVLCGAQGVWSAVPTVTISSGGGTVAAITGASIIGTAGVNPECAAAYQITGSATGITPTLTLSGMGSHGELVQVFSVAGDNSSAMTNGGVHGGSGGQSSPNTITIGGTPNSGDMQVMFQADDIGTADTRSDTLISDDLLSSHYFQSQYKLSSGSVSLNYSWTGGAQHDLVAIGFNIAASGGGSTLFRRTLQGSGTRAGARPVS